MNWWQQPLFALDLETTGADPQTCEVVSWAVARVDPSGHVLDHHGGICRTQEWSEEAEAVHGLPRSVTAHGVPGAVALAAIARRLNSIAELGVPLVAFNAAYDLTILDRHGAFPSLLVLDPRVLDQQADRYRKGKRTLEDVYHHYTGEAFTGAHTALADAVAAARLAFALAERFETLRRPAAELHDLQVEWAREQAAGLQAHFRKKGNPAAVVDGSWPVKKGELPT